jgi:23S rRNA (guanosine2251-2'-O)-methyltransferase
MREREMIYGIHAVEEALEGVVEIDRILLKKDFRFDSTSRLFTLLRERGLPYQRVPVERLNRLTRKNHQGVIALTSAISYHHLADLIPFIYESGHDPFFVLLDGITDVRNFGAIARTCECAGVNALIIPNRGSVSVNSDAMKTSSGALQHLPVCKESSITQAIRYLQSSGIKVFGASERASVNYTDVSFSCPTAIVIGAEDTGISSENLRYIDELIKIPQFGEIGSLNVSVASGILIYEAIRQRAILK